MPLGVWLIPARAELPTGSPTLTTCPWAHPCVRGASTIAERFVEKMGGSSLRARGFLIGSFAMSVLLGLIPARAGLPLPGQGGCSALCAFPFG